MNRQLELIPKAYGEPLDLTTQVSRVPGIDAPCICSPDQCRGQWPWCDWKTPLDEGEE